MDKRKILLETIDKKLQKINIKELEFYEKYIGPGFLKKFKRLFFSPRVVIKLKLQKLREKLINKPKPEQIDSNLELLFWFITKLDSLNELKTFKFLIKNINDEDIFYDIGAEMGLYTSLALELCKEVHSFEPIPYNVAVLKKRFSKFKNVYINEVALADYIGTTTFCLGPTTMVKSVKNLYPKKAKKKEIVVKTTTLEEYLKYHNKPTFIKMDVEGAEHLIIKGGYKFFKENNPVLVIEILGDEFLENSMKTINLLKELRYKSYQINLNGDLEPFDHKNFQFTKGVCNFVFKK